MPRQDVPYGGAICRLRERIAEIFDKLGEKLHTINGVPGDGDGNVKIVSGSSAVVISNDPTQNEIAVSLDTSQLPAASVSSVNGQTGAVALDAGDIPTVGGDVQADLQDLANDISGNTAAINAEVLARQGADSTLQTNINAVSASLPAAAAAAVAADPTVAYISSELSNKVDLSDVSTVETPDTIAKRNGSGRLVAADPASGATDKTLVTANWVSQSGAGRPNNLIHSAGNEVFSGIKEATGNGFIRKRSATFNLTNPPAGIITDENYAMLDINGAIAVQMFNSYTANAQTIFQISSKYPFTDTDNVNKTTQGVLWLVTYKDRVVLFLRFVDKNGVAHMQSIGTVTE